MAYKVNNQKQADGTRLLSYGKGKGKLTARLTNEGGKWHVQGFHHTHTSMKEAKAAWGAWAESAYGEGGAKTPSTPPAAPGPPSLPGPPTLLTGVKGGPPKLGGPVVDYVVKGTMPPSLPPKNLDTEFTADPFSPANRHPGGDLTPVGVLIEIQGWYERYATRIDAINHELARKSQPGFNPFKPLMQAIEDCLEREQETAHAG